MCDDKSPIAQVIDLSFKLEALKSNLLTEKKNPQTYQNLHNYRTRYLRLKSPRLEDDKAESCHQYKNCKPVSCSPVQQDLCSPISSPTLHSTRNTTDIDTRTVFKSRIKLQKGAETWNSGLLILRVHLINKQLFHGS